MTNKHPLSHLRLAKSTESRPEPARPANSGGAASQPGSANLVRPGTALRTFRAERGWTLAAVSEKTGLPISTLSKIETGKMELTIDKLLRISLALEINIADLFGTPVEDSSGAHGSRRRSITRAGDGQESHSPSGRYLYQAYDLLNKDLTPAIVEVTARSIEDFGELHRHQGEEVVYVISGELALYTDTYTPARLKAGDTAYFDSGMGHAYVAVGEEPCRIFSVFSTPGDRILSAMQGISDG